MQPGAFWFHIVPRTHASTDGSFVLWVEVVVFPKSARNLLFNEHGGFVFGQDLLTMT
jgi:hypothetical protein